MIKVELDKAQWRKALLKLGAAATLLPKAIDQLAQKEAEFFRKRIVEGLKNQAPVGRKLAPRMNPWTEATRRFLGVGGSKLLIERGDLVRNIVVWKSGKDYMVGVRPGAVNSEGRSLVNIARVQEEGVPEIWIKLTPKMIRFLAMIARKAQRPLPAGRSTRPGWIRVSIPARPFMRPVFAKYGWKGAVEYRVRGYLRDLATTMFW